MKIDARNPRTQKLILACLAIAGVGYYYFMNEGLSFSYRSRAKVIAERRDERDKLDKDVKRARASATRLAELRRESADLEVRWHEVEARLPTDLDAKELMSDITRLGTRESLQFLLVEPQGERSLDFCTEVPFSVRVLGYYNQLGRFLADLDNMPRVLKLSGLRLVQNPKAKDDKTQPPLIAELEVSTFILGGGMPATTAPPVAPSEGGTPVVGASATPPPAPPAAGVKAQAKKAAKASAEAPAPITPENSEPRVEGGGPS
jgi:type IV pilus assembly protein PilO